MGKTRSTLTKSERNGKFASNSSSNVKYKPSKLVSSLKKSKSSSSATQKNPQENFNVPINLSTSGKIIKTKKKLQPMIKKNVSFSTNLTDILAAGQILQTADKIKLKFGNKNKSSSLFNMEDSSASSVSQLLSSCTELGHMKKNLKAHIPIKKNRLKIKRETFQKKIEIIKKSEKEKRAAKQRQQTIIVGDMQPMLQALETDMKSITSTPMSISKSILVGNHPLGNLQSFVAEHKLEEFKSIPKKNKINMKKRQQEIAQGLEYFAQGLSGKPKPMSSF